MTVPLPSDFNLPLDLFPSFRRGQYELSEKVYLSDKRFNLLMAPPGCVSGETVIQVARGSGIKVSNKRQIRDEFDRQEGTRRRADIETYTRSLVDGRFALQVTPGVTYSGEKETYALTLKNGLYLRATPEHLILTSGGWKPLLSLSGADLVTCDSVIKGKDKRKPKPDYLTVQGLRYHPYASVSYSKRFTTRSTKEEGPRNKVALHRLVMDAALNRKGLEEFIWICRMKPEMASTLTFLSPYEFAVHHIDGNHRNNALENLEVLTHEEHASKHNPYQHLQVTPEWHQVKSIKKFGIEPTYDLQCSEENPNFVANGIVVHNSGKSLIHYVISQLYDLRTLTLVSTKSLADQILRDPFSHTEIRGHGNYLCASKIYDPTGELSDLRCMSRGYGCEYQSRVDQCLQSQNVLTNYAHWCSLARTGQVDRLGKFDLLICDEGHLIHDLLTDYVSVEIYEARLAYLLQQSIPQLSGNTIDSCWLTWLRETVYSLSRKRQSQSSQKEYIQQIDRLQSDLERVLLESSKHSWVVEHTEKTVKFSPVWSRAYTEKYLFRGIPKIVISSGTLLPETAPLLGVSKEDHSYFQVPSTFPAERRPFIYLPTCRVDFRMSEGHWRMLMSRVNQIIEDRLDRKGLIHGRSYDRCREIMERSLWREFMISHSSSRDKQEAVTKYLSSDSPAILVSPSVEEGHDFKGDACRYQILLKVPYTDTRSPVMKERVKQNKKYGYFKAAEKILQQYGRSNRSERDWSETFILDDHWEYFQRVVTFPDYFKKAWKVSRQVPEPINF